MISDSYVNKRLWLLVLLILFAENKLSAQCTVFVLQKENQVVYGQNLDWLEPLSGYVIINKRGVKKNILHWQGHWPAAKKDERVPVTWISKYGSVTFTYLGRDFIEGGMNEAGLMIDEASFTSEYPPDDGRPGVSCGQWMQYQLDNYATVEEVLKHLGDLRPDGEEWHYLVADRLGNACAIEYFAGKPTVYKNDALHYPVLTNTSFRQAMDHIPMDKAFGGNIDIASGTDSYGRFVKAAWLIDKFKKQEHDIVDYAFEILCAVANETTRRSVVYDSGNSRVLWISEINPQCRWLNLEMLDFSTGTPAQMLHADFTGAGELNSFLIQYDAVLIQDLLLKKFADPLPQTLELLQHRGYTLPEVIKLIIRQAR